MGNQVALFNAPGPQGPPGAKGPKGDAGPAGPAGSALAVSGTGFVHWSGTGADAFARAVDLSGVDVTGLLPAAKLAAGSSGQFITTSGTTAIWATFSLSNIPGGTDGQVFVSSGTSPTWTSLITVEMTHGRLTAGGTGSDLAVSIGPDLSAPTTRSGVFFNKTGATAPTSIYSDQNGIIFQSIGGWLLQWLSGALQSVSGNLTLGTSGGAFTTTLQAGNASSVMQLAAGTQGGVALGASLAAAGHVRYAAGTQIYVRDAGNTTDHLFFGDDGGNNVNMFNGYSSVTLSASTQLIGVSSGLIAWEAGADMYLDQSTIHLRSAAHTEYITITPITAAVIAFAETVTTSAAINYIGRTSDAATHDLTIQGQYSFATATGTNRKPGNINFDVGPTTNGLTGVANEGHFQWSRGGTVLQTLAFDNANNFVTWNIPNSIWEFVWTIGNGEMLLANNLWAVGGATAWWVSGGTTTTYMGATPAATAPLIFDYTAATAPTIRSGSNATSLTVGPNKSAASLILQGDAATTILTLTTIADFATGVLLDQITTPSAPAAGKCEIFVDSTDGLPYVIDANGNIYNLGA